MKLALGLGLQLGHHKCPAFYISPSDLDIGPMLTWQCFIYQAISPVLNKWPLLTPPEGLWL